MKRPIATARTLPKFNHILLMTREERLKLIKNRYCMTLERMRSWVKDLFSSMNRISDNDDF